MMDFNFFGSITKINLSGRSRLNSQTRSKSEKSDTKQNRDGLEKPIEIENKEKIEEEIKVDNNDGMSKIKETDEQRDELRVARKMEDDEENVITNGKKEDKIQPNDENNENQNDTKELDEEIEARDIFEVYDTKFYRVLTKSFYESNMGTLKQFQKGPASDSSHLKSSTKRTKSTRNLKERKLVISAPQNFRKVETEFSVAFKKQAEHVRVNASNLKKSVSMENILRDSGDSVSSDMLGKLEKGRLEFASLGDLTSDGASLNVESSKSVGELCSGSSGDEGNQADSFGKCSESKNNSVTYTVHKDDSEEDIDKAFEEYASNMVTMRDKSQSTPELLKSINQSPKEKFERQLEPKFPVVDDENVEVRRKPSIRRNRVSKTTDFDLGMRRQADPANPKNFEIRGIVKFHMPNNTNPVVITKLNQDYIAYENENFYRVNEKVKSKELLKRNVILKAARYLNNKSKESKEVELRDNFNSAYVLYFDSIRYAKQFMENEKVQAYVTDNKTTIKKTLLRFLGKRSSREILEKKGIYKNEPIFGNTLRDIYIKGGSMVPVFIYRVLELIEKPENIKSLGLYRTSGNLATVQKIRFEVDNGRIDILDQYSKDPDVLTGSLKLFFRELKEPLISCDVCEKMLEITKTELKQMTAKDHQKIRSTLVKCLHQANLETFFVLMRHLLEVVKYKEHNKMDTYNLAVCWGPSMIFAVHSDTDGANVELSKDIVSQSHDATRLVDFLLGFYEMHPSELGALGKRPDSIEGKYLLKRQESKDSVDSYDSLTRSQKKSASSQSLSVDEITKKIIELIEQNLTSEGLYKKSGSVDKTNKIMKKLNKKKIHELEKYKNDVNDVTDALKKYLRESQESLVTREAVDLVLAAAGENHQNYLEPITRRKVTSIIEDTSKKDTLIYLLRHLAKVVDHQNVHKVSKTDIINIWTNVLNYQKKIHQSNDAFAKFLTVSMEVFNDNLPDLVRLSFNNNCSSPNRNDNMAELLKDLKNQQEKDRNSRYDNVECEAGEASVLDDKTERTKL